MELAVMVDVVMAVVVVGGSKGCGKGSRGGGGDGGSNEG